MCSFMKVSNHIDKTLSDRLRELKKKKFQLVHPKSARSRSREQLLERAFITKFKSQFKRGFRNVVVTRASINRDLASDVQQV